MKRTHFSFPSIEQFKNVHRKVQEKAQFVGLDENQEPIFNRAALLPTLSYEGTIKVHGTNASILLTKDDFYCQSREQVITPEKDNAGFARFVHELPLESFEILRSNFNQEKVAIYGEWAGKGIQKGVAISQVDKAFFVFGVRVILEDEKEEWLDIQGWNLPERFYNIYNFPTYQIDIDFEKPEYALEQINKWVLEVEEECPVAKKFGISGIGEGIVFTSLDLDYKGSRFTFKCKGSKHSQSKVCKLATVDIEKFESNQAFVNFALDEGRLEQGYNWLAENNKPQDQQSVGDYLRWLFNDVIKECKLEMEENKISEKELGKLLANPAKRWYFTRINK